MYLHSSLLVLDQSLFSLTLFTVVSQFSSFGCFLPFHPCHFLSFLLRMLFLGLIIPYFLPFLCWSYWTLFISSYCLSFLFLTFSFLCILPGAYLMICSWVWGTVWQFPALWPLWGGGSRFSYAEMFSLHLLCFHFRVTLYRCVSLFSHFVSFFSHKHFYLRVYSF